MLCQCSRAGLYVTYISWYCCRHSDSSVDARKLSVQAITACKERLQHSSVHLTWPGDNIGECGFLLDLSCRLGPENMMLSAASRVR